ncbi:DNA polymerase-3 subunit gamma/tau [Constrictibacter sp. MBR-5]|jgi:DNA polymerase-3 subunit gamma/tau|uniref:DNA polymerase III subunit gamma/tau n=1 Tax=Constrictibacter sp. MBR-5 TaxID=3156467 RepID=UPI00339715B8
MDDQSAPGQSPAPDIPTEPGLPGLPPPSGEAAQPYRVLARKYRPKTFSELIGQEALVRTLSNALESGRLAHAFILTGVRGVGKTTTARIIARALNCTGPDGKGGPTIQPCGVCDNCVAIAQDRHVDVLEMDAASRTGIGDVRELIEGVRYRPVSARYKVYIIDEVHMLSTQAFNGLLKTLEEPPEHVKFIFATTEIRKVPVTVLSRCQRFDLRRVASEVLMAHFERVARAEGVTLEPEALALVARAADGSVRDGLSILDQAIAHAGPAPVSAGQVREMLGLADRTRVFDLAEALLRGEARAALVLFADMHDAGADPVALIQDLLELTHWLTRLRVAPDDADDMTVAEAERVRGKGLAAQLSMPVLTRLWQLLLKGLSETQHAPAPRLAVEMLFVRIAYAASLPTPAEIVAQLAGEGGAGPAGGSGSGGGGTRGVVPAAHPAVETAAHPTARATASAADRPAATAPTASAPTASAPPAPAREARPLPPLVTPAQPEPPRPSASAPTHTAQARAALAPRHEDPEPARTTPPEPPRAEPPPEPVVQAPETPTGTPAGPASFAEAVAMFASHGEMLLHANLCRNVHPVAFRPGRIEIRPTALAPQNLSGTMASKLTQWTGTRWVVSVSGDAGEPTLAQQEEARLQRLRETAAEHPLVRAVMAAFPGTAIATVREPGPPADEPPAAAAEQAMPDESMPDGRPSAPFDADMADLDFSDGFDEEDT